MNIAIIVESFPYVTETFVLNHIKGLIDQGCTVQIFSFSKPQNPIAHKVYYEYRLDKQTVYPIDVPKNYLQRIVKGLWLIFIGLCQKPIPTLKAINFFKLGVNAIKLRYLFESSLFRGMTDKIDLIHCHFGTMAKRLLFYQELGFVNGTLVTSFHGYDIDSLWIRNDILFYRDLIESRSVVIANSNYTKNRLLEVGFDSKKIQVMPVALDTEYFKCLSPKRNERVIRIVTVARLVEFKGHQYSIKAVSELIHEGCNINYTIVGDGPLKDDLMALAESLEVASHVNFTGSLLQSEIKKILNESDIFLLTGIHSTDGREENQGLAIQEAQSMEIPVIVSKIGGVTEGILDGISGFAVEPKNISEIKAKLILLYNNEGLRNDMGHKGRNYVVNKFSIDIQSKEMINLYAKILENRI